MAIKALHHTIIENHEIGGSPIYGGMPVYIDTDGAVDIWTSTVNGNNFAPHGLAADDHGLSDPLGSFIWLNPVSLNFMAIDSDGNKRTGRKIWANETVASGKMSVYVGQGRFITDQFQDHDEGTWTPGSLLYTNTTGQINTTDSGPWSIGRLVKDVTKTYTWNVDTNMGVIELELDIQRDLN